MSSLPEKPEKRLTQLFLSMFSADELRRLISYNFPEELSVSLPGANAPPVAVAEAASRAILERGELAALWRCLIEARPLRKDEIEAARDAILQAIESARDAIVQAIGSTAKPGKAGPIRILFVLSCPPGRYQLDTQEEIRQIRAELNTAVYRHHFTHELITAATYKELRMALRRHRPHILHIACHGTPEAEIVLSDGHGEEERIEAVVLVQLLDVLKGDLALVILNACHSAAITPEVLPVVDLVLGMRGAVDDRSAIAFAAVFYESIAAGDTVEVGFRLGINELHRLKAAANIPELLPLVGPQRQRRFV